MGHLLGAAPAPPAARRDDVIQAHTTHQRLQVRVTAVQRHALDHPRIAAYAIDSPQPDTTHRGAGFEITGWVIGRDAPVAAVRVVHNGQLGEATPLDVRRPDVATAYPAFPHAAGSGFALWAPLTALERGRRQVLRSDDASFVGATPASPAAPAAIDQFQKPLPRGVEEPIQLTLQAVIDPSESVDLATFHVHMEYTSIEPPSGSRLVDAPDFVIIGAQRGGTTSLHAYLAAHPRITLPATKELHYFTDRYSRGLDWYRGQYPPNLPIGHLTGEATPYALFHPLAPRRIVETAPDAKLIVLLRNPVDRAYSHYLMEHARDDEPLDFAAALTAEPDRLAGEEARLTADPTYLSRPHKHFSYLARGDYAPQLERWLAQFPRGQLLILRSEDLYSRTAETFAAVTAFLGLEPDTATPFAIHNRTPGPPLPADLRERLNTHFAPRTARLAALLGWDPHWT